MSEVLRYHSTTNEKKHVSWSREWTWNAGQEESKRSRKEWLKSNKAKRAEARKMNNGNRTTNQQERWDMMKARYMYQILRSPNEQSVNRYLRIHNNDSSVAQITQSIFLLCGIPANTDIRQGLNQFQNLEPLGVRDPNDDDDDDVDEPIGERDPNEDFVVDNIALRSLLNLLLKQPPILEAWGPPTLAALFEEVTSEDSADRRALASANQMRQETQNLPPHAQHAVWHYALHANPRDPAAAIRELRRRFILDDELQQAPDPEAEDRRDQERDGAAGDPPSPNNRDDSSETHHEERGDPDSPVAGSHSTSVADTATDIESGQETDDHMSCEATDDRMSGQETDDHMSDS